MHTSEDILDIDADPVNAHWLRLTGHLPDPSSDEFQVLLDRLGLTLEQFTKLRARLVRNSPASSEHPSSD